jgi:ATP-binding cassette subfamily B protein
MSTVTGKAFDVGLFKRTMSYVAPYNAVFSFTIALTLLLSVLGPLRPYLIYKMVNESIGDSDAEGLLRWALIILGILVLEGVVQFSLTYLANWLGQNVIRDLRTNLYRHISQFKLRYFDQTPIGTIVTRAVSDIETIAEVFASGILVIIGDIFRLVLIIGFMFYLNWKFALIVLIPVPILIFATRIFKNAIKKAFQDVRTNVSKLNTFVQEHITGMNIVQIFGKQKQEQTKFREINKAHRAAHIKSVWAYSIFFPVVELLSAASVALLIYSSLGQIGTHDNPGDLFGQVFAFVLYIFMMYRPIRQLADRFNVLQMGMVGSERVFKVLDTEATIEKQAELKDFDLKGNIEFTDVNFAYDGVELVLKNLSFKVNEGETVAFVGATGAGKSSVVNLMGRFYEFQKGSIKIEGRDIRDIESEFLRTNMAIVLQNVFLFSGSILNNITLQDPSISKEKVIEASKAVGAHDFIMKLPGDYDYDVAERGGMLSTGQRQLISFIRAYVHEPKILVLDEATSSIDTESEEMIQRAQEKLTQNRTSIVIAHRLSTIQRADRIIVLEKGEKIEEGNHEELITQNGHYKKLYDLQFS